VRAVLLGREVSHCLLLDQRVVRGQQGTPGLPRVACDMPACQLQGRHLGGDVQRRTASIRSHLERQGRLPRARLAVEDVQARRHVATEELVQPSQPSLGAARSPGDVQRDDGIDLLAVERAEVSRAVDGRLWDVGEDVEGHASSSPTNTALWLWISPSHTPLRGVRGFAQAAAPRCFSLAGTGRR